MKIRTIKINFSEVWERNLFILAFVQFLAMLGMNGCVPFLPLYVRELGVVGESAERFWSGMVFAGPYFLSIIFVPIWGNLADRYGKKLMMIRAILGLAIAMFLMGFARDVYQLFFLRVFQGATSGFIAATLGFTISNTPLERQGYAIGILQSSQSAGGIAGPLIGGIISDIFGFRVVFFLVAILCIIGGLLISTLVVENNRSTEKNKESVIEVLQFILHNKRYSIPMLIIILAQIGIFLTFPILPYYLEQLNAPSEFLSSLTGTMVGISGFFNILFAPIWGRWSDRKPIQKLIQIASFALGLTMLLHSIVGYFLLLFPLRIAVGIFVAGLVPTLYSHLGKIVSDEKVGSIMGFASSASLFGSLIAFLGSAIISSNFDLHWGFIASGVILISIYFLRI